MTTIINGTDNLGVLGVILIAVISAILFVIILAALIVGVRAIIHIIRDKWYNSHNKEEHKPADIDY